MMVSVESCQKLFTVAKNFQNAQCCQKLPIVAKMAKSCKKNAKKIANSFHNMSSCQNLADLTKVAKIWQIYQN